MLVAATEQVSKGLMSSLNWAIKRSERLARVMEVKCRGAGREAKLQRVEERMVSGRTEKSVDHF